MIVPRYPESMKVVRYFRRTEKFREVVESKMTLGSGRMMDLGNLYTASLPAWIGAGLEDALEQDLDLTGREFVTLGYGSGDAAEAMPIRVVPHWREAAAKIRFREALEGPVVLEREQYEALHDRHEFPAVDDISTGRFVVDRIGMETGPEFQDIGVEYYRYVPDRRPDASSCNPAQRPVDETPGQEPGSSVRALIIDDRSGEIFENILGHHRHLAEPIARHIPGQSVQVDGQASCPVRVEALSDEPGHTAGENIARASGRHSRVAGLIEIKIGPVADHRLVPFERQHNTVRGGKLPDEFPIPTDPLDLDLGMQPAILPWMRSEDRGGATQPQQAHRTQHRVDPIGIENERKVELSDQVPDARNRLRRGTQPRANREHLELRGDPQDLLDRIEAKSPGLCV